MQRGEWPHETSAIAMFNTLPGNKACIANGSCTSSNRAYKKKGHGTKQFSCYIRYNAKRQHSAHEGSRLFLVARIHELVAIAHYTD